MAGRIRGDRSGIASVSERSTEAIRGCRGLLAGRLPQDGRERTECRARGQTGMGCSGVASNEAAGIWRKRATTDRVLEKQARHLSEASEDDASDRVILTETTEQLRQAMESLPDAWQQVVKLRIYENLTFQQIADQLQIPLGTALTQMRRALERLRSEIESRQRKMRSDPNPGRSSSPSVDEAARQQCMLYLLGELTTGQARTFEKQLADDESLQNELDSQSRLIAGLSMIEAETVTTVGSSESSMRWMVTIAAIAATFVIIIACWPAKQREPMAAVDGDARVFADCTRLGRGRVGRRSGGHHRVSRRLIPARDDRFRRRG